MRFIQLLAQPRIILFAQRQKAFSQALDDYQKRACGCARAIPSASRMANNSISRSAPAIGSARCLLLVVHGGDTMKLSLRRGSQ
jgi:hypothetical protein